MLVLLIGADRGLANICPLIFNLLGIGSGMVILQKVPEWWLSAPKVSSQCLGQNRRGQANCSIVLKEKRQKHPQPLYWTCFDSWWTVPSSNCFQIRFASKLNDDDCLVLWYFQQITIYRYRRHARVLNDALVWGLLWCDEVQCESEAQEISWDTMLADWGFPAFIEHVRALRCKRLDSSKLCPAAYVLEVSLDANSKSAVMILLQPGLTMMQGMFDHWLQVSMLSSSKWSLSFEKTSSLASECFVTLSQDGGK